MANLLSTTIGGGSSVLVAENRKSIFNAAVVDFYGNKPLTFFNVDFVAAVNAETGANEAIQAVLEIIGQYATVVIRGALFDTNTQMCFAIESPNITQNWDGDGAETLVEQIEDEIVALGATFGNNNFNMTAVTCTVKTGFQFA